jgi:hypothetical protein
MTMGMGELLIELRKTESLPFLFVGSGMSIRYIEAPGWEQLLRKFATSANSSEFYFEQIRDKAIRQLMTDSKDIHDPSILYPLIASLIEEDFNRTWYVSERYAESRINYAKEVKEGISPFKLELSEYFKSISLAEPKLSHEIQLLRDLSAKSIAGIITTNYDCLMENMFPEFTPYIGQEELIFSNSYSVSEIYKIHGCCSKPNSIIINKTDYFDYNNKNAYLAAKLLTIFVEHPIVFMGYSIQDDDIQRILKSIIDCLSPDKLKELQKRLIFVEWDNGIDNAEIAHYTHDFGNRKHIEMTRVRISDYSELYKMLLQIKSHYPTKMIRRIKEDIYNLTLTTNPRTNLFAVNTLEDITDEDEIEYVFGIGALEIGRRGYKSVEAHELYTDVVLDNQGFNIDFIVENTIPALISSSTRHLPVYKYLSQYTKEIPENLKSYMNTSYDEAFMTPSLYDIRKARPNDTWEDIVRSSVSLSTKFNRLSALPVNKVDVDVLYNYLEEILQETGVLLLSTRKSLIKKLIRQYDWLRYSSDK